MTGAVAAVSRGRVRNLAVGWLALASVLIAAQELLTPQATAGWHYIAIYPFVTVVAVYGAYAAATTLLSRRVLMRAALVGVGVLGLTYSGLLTAKYFRTLRSKEPQFSAWSGAIYTLSGELRRVKASIFTADWGILEPLFALEPSARYTELAYILQHSAPADLIQVRSAVTAVPGPKLIVTHVNGALVFPSNDADLVKALGSHLHLVATVTGINREPVYQVYRYR